MRAARTRYIIAVTGGIGSGKSVVCRMLMVMGYAVYDCDSRAREIIDANTEIQCRIADAFGDGIICDGKINRNRLASIVFTSNKMLEKLNGIVHSFVRADIAEWVKDKGICFIETAILYQSGLDKMVDEVWVVDAPESKRIERVVARNGITPDEVKHRIDSQSFEPGEPHIRIKNVINDDIIPVLPQIENLFKHINYEN